MADIESGFDDLEGQMGELESAIGVTQAVSQAFKVELQSLQQTMTGASQQVDSLTRSVGWGLRKAFDGLVFDGMRLSDAIKMVGRSMADSVLTQALKPVQNAMAGFLLNGVESLVGGLTPFRDGAAFSAGRVTPFARGGIVSQATSFPMRGGLGLMGEAGPEAIMPLTRGADGALGVCAQGGGRAVNVTMNISTPDAEGFRRSRTQIAAQMSRAIARGSRNN